MQSPRMDALSTFEKTALRSTLQDILTDSDVTTAITYRTFTSESVNHKTGAITRDEDDASVNAVRREMTNAEVDRSGGTLKITDRWFLVDQADLSAEPKKSDRIIEGSTEYEVIMWRGGVLGLVWEVAARKV